MIEADDFEKEIVAVLQEKDEMRKHEIFLFVATKTAHLYIDYDEWGFGSIMATTTSLKTVKHYGGFHGDLEIQWCQERNTYLLPRWKLLFDGGQEGFINLLAFITKETGMTLAISLFNITNMLKQHEIPFPSIEGTPLEWMIFQEEECNRIVMKRLIGSQLISRTESTQ